MRAVERRALPFLLLQARPEKLPKPRITRKALRLIADGTSSERYAHNCLINCQVNLGLRGCIFVDSASRVQVCCRHNFK
jgi:hypothetical protein